MDWDGTTTLGDGWAVYEGPVADSRPHRHLAVQLAIGLKQPLAMTGDRGRVAGPAILVRAATRHWLAPVAGVRIIFAEVDSLAGQAWSAATAGEEILQAPADLFLLRELRLAEDAAAAMQRLTGAGPQRALDQRLARALAALAENPGSSGAVARAARTAGVSVSSLRALAAEALVAPLAQWRQWRMLMKAASVIAAGQSLAEAAAESGFSDQAHLTRTMGRFFGITPGVAATSLRRPHGLRAV